MLKLTSLLIPEHQSRLEEKFGTGHRCGQPGEHGHLGLVGVQRLHVEAAEAVTTATAQEAEQGLVLRGK